MEDADEAVAQLAPISPRSPCWAARSGLKIGSKRWATRSPSNPPPDFGFPPSRLRNILTPSRW
jgi:hypothetical protein